MDDVLRLRKLYESTRLHFPIEITVAGSSGLGWFSDGQDKADLLHRVGEVAKEFEPFSFRFRRVERFPATNVYYLAPDDSSLFHDFQHRLASCGLLFESTPFDYVPHCTIAILAQDATAEAHSEVSACRVPTDQIRVFSVSFWSVDREKQLAQQGERIGLGT